MADGFNDKKINHIEDMKRRLYSQDPKAIKARIEGKLKDISYGVKQEWAKETAKPAEEQFKIKPSFLKKFFIFSVAFFLIALVSVTFKFYRGANTISTENIEINVLGNSFAAGGEELPLQIEVTNKNNLPLELSDLLIEYPKGSSGDATGDFVRTRTSLGSIGAGQTVTNNAKVTLFGEQGTTKDIKISLEYRVESSNAIFVKEATHTVNISSAPINLSVDAPTDTTSGQEVHFTVKVTPNGAKTIQGMLLKMDYPPGFQFTDSSPKSISGNNIWDLGDLAQGIEKTVTVTGVLYGQNEEQKSFHFYVGEKDAKDQTALGVVYNSYLATLNIKQAFVEAHLLINGQDQADYSIPSAGVVHAQINWANNLPTRVDDVEITAHITGDALNKSSVNTLDGFYDSASDTINWSKNTASDLATVDPGNQGSVSFSFSPASLFSQSGSIISDPSIQIEVSIKAKQPAEGNVTTDINNFETKVIKINSDLQVKAQARYYEGPLTNTGPMPPKAENKTTYTITWTATNSANSVSNAVVSAALPFYVRYTGVTSPVSENLTYDDATREVSWNLGTLPPGTGLQGDPREVSFQVELAPSISQIGSAPQLLTETVMTGTDNFTNSPLKSTRPALNTRLSNDSQFKSGNETVVE